jgi:hypothetical protein
MCDASAVQLVSGEMITVDNPANFPEAGTIAQAFEVTTLPRKARLLAMESR